MHFNFGAKIDHGKYKPTDVLRECSDGHVTTDPLISQTCRWYKDRDTGTTRLQIITITTDILYCAPYQLTEGA